MAVALKKILGLFLIIISISFLLVSGQKALDTPKELGDEKLLVSLPEGSSRLVLKGNDTNWQFTFLEGPQQQNDPIGTSYEADQILHYGTFNNITKQLIIENVTSQLVYPYQYDFVVDSAGRVHTAFITGKYTLFYAVRETNGTWIEQQVTDSSYWWAWAPDIELTSEGKPVLTYVVSYKSKANEIFPMPSPFEYIGARSLHYAVFNGSAWDTYDVMGQIGSKITPSRLLEIQYPSILIENDTTYLAFTNRIPQAGETQILFAKFPANPVSATTNKSLQQFVYTKAYRLFSTAGVFTFPKIFLYEKSVYLAGGTWIRGGAWYAYLEDVSVSPKNATWISGMYSNEYLSQEVSSMSGYLKDGTIFLSWSPYFLFDTTKNRFQNDIILIGVDIKKGASAIENFTLTFLTDTINVRHSFPNILETENTINVVSILYNNTDTEPYLSLASIGQFETIVEGGGLALGITLIAVIALIPAFLYVIKKVPVREKDEEILPHMINLKDSITRD